MSLDASLTTLIAAAKEASRFAYCPYSSFPVGAALLGADGQVYTGCNVENASYGLTLCAERNAVAAMVRGGARAMSIVVVYTPTPRPTSPCGACRQVLNELAPDARVVCVCDGAEQLDTTGATLLPHAFGPENL